MHIVEVLCAGAVSVCSGGCGVCSLSYAGGIGFHYGPVSTGEHSLCDLIINPHLAYLYTSYNQ